MQLLYRIVKNVNLLKTVNKKTLAEILQGVFYYFINFYF